MIIIIIIIELKDRSVQCMKTMIDLDKKKRNTLKTNIMTEAECRLLRILAASFDPPRWGTGYTGLFRKK